ncbi:XrtA/PEP-CTERM system histidine kinase PrsK [Acidovorax sp. SRB_24]|uniref:XrtA/PEP-CTERM system histidine kinase PrsK n=1 Tax=Acidovorax sp. SRB_24 TaxID=1962700 RepID=UPI00145F1DCA|nr:XrtA/PEP-CTERM system histidine kinase PrsK [Acidovorax sp. SRB_24]NMM75450.1 histidine kinase [Acidovorax sp. SRB_24]
MNQSEPSLIYWSLGLSGIAYAILVLRLIRQGAMRKPVNRIAATMLAAALVTVLWSGFSLLALAVNPGWWLAAQVADMLRYLCWGIFLALFFAPGASWVHSAAGRWWPGWMLAALLGVPLLIETVHALVGPLGNTFLMVLLALGALVMVEQLFRNLPEDSVWSAKPVCLGLAGTFVFDLYLFSQGVLFRGIDLDALSVRPFVHALMVPLLLLATTRHRNWISKIRVSRKVVFHSATLALVGLYLLFIAGVGYYVRFFGGDWGGALQVGLVFVALVLASALALSGSLRARLRVLLGKHFFRYRFDYREEWLKFTATLSSQARPQEAGRHVVKGLADMLESPAGALWLLRPEEDQYRQVNVWNMAPTKHTEDQHAELATFMQSTGWVVNLEEFRAAPWRYRDLRLPKWLSEYPQAWLVVPLWQSTSLLGFVVLASPRTPVDVNWEVNDLLKTAGRQAASLLAQIQATEALLEARKFEAFNRMSAFVVHDLKNIIAQLSLMLKNAKRLQDNPEFQADMLMTVENSLERMRQLMLQLRGSGTSGASSVGVNLGKIAERLAASALGRGRQVTLELAPRVFTRGQAERVERIIGHLVHNALDATDVDDRVWIKVDRFASHARVEVGDSGQGMTEEFVQTRLFKPFQTTKESGMGIGTYESFQYVQELGGKVAVDSQVGKGTVVSLLLPSIEVFGDSDTPA